MAHDCASDALRVARRHGDHLHVAVGNIRLAEIALDRGDRETAGARAAVASRIADDLANAWLQTDALYVAGAVALGEHDADGAIDRFTQALAAAESVDYRFLIAKSLIGLAQAHPIRGDTAAAYAQQALDISRDAGCGLLESLALDCLGASSRADGAGNALIPANVPGVRSWPGG